MNTPFSRAGFRAGSTTEQGTQLSLNAIEAAYLNSGIAAFPNLGNTCYINSTITCLSHTLEMTDIFLCATGFNGLVFSGEYTELLNITSSQCLSSLCNFFWGFMIAVFKQVMQEVWLQPSPPTKHGNTPSLISTPLESLKKNSYVRAVNLQTLKDVLGAKHSQFEGHRQNDAQEFLSYLVRDLHEEMEYSEKEIPNHVFTASLK